MRLSTTSDRYQICQRICYSEETALLIYPYTSPLSPAPPPRLAPIPFAWCARVIINYGHVRALWKRISTRSDDNSRTLHTSLLQPTASRVGAAVFPQPREDRFANAERTRCTEEVDRGGRALSSSTFVWTPLFGAESCPCCFCFSRRRALKGETPPRHHGT